MGLRDDVDTDKITVFKLPEVKFLLVGSAASKFYPSLALARAIQNTYWF